MPSESEIVKAANPRPPVEGGGLLEDLRMAANLTENDCPGESVGCVLGCEQRATLLRALADLIEAWQADERQSLDWSGGETSPFQYHGHVFLKNLRSLL